MPLQDAEYTAGQSAALKVTLRDISTGALRFWNTTLNSGNGAFEAYASGHVGNYAIAVSEPAPGSYTFPIPTALPASVAGSSYRAKMTRMAGDSLAASDLDSGVWKWEFAWSGTAVIDIGTAATAAVLAPGQAFNNTGQTTAIPSTYFPAASGSVPNPSPNPFDGVTVTWATNYPVTQPFSIIGFDASGWTKIVVTVKQNPSTALDSAAKLVVQVSNPPAGSDGILLLNGAAPVSPILATDGSIDSVSATTTGLSLSLSLAARGMGVAAGSYFGEVTIYASAGKLAWLGSFRVDIEQTVRAAVT